MTCWGENAWCCGRQRGRCRVSGDAGAVSFLSWRSDEIRIGVGVRGRAPLRRMTPEPLSNVAVHVYCLVSNMDEIAQLIG
jgi:hypothetical protein